jgi:hypothetical protein
MRSFRRKTCFAATRSSPEALAWLRYLAALCAAPAALAGFYGRNFGMHEIGRSADGDVALSDGTFNLTPGCASRPASCRIENVDC